MEEPAVQNQPVRARARARDTVSSSPKLPAEFASYDEIVIAKIRKRFDEETLKLERSTAGRVKVQFYLYSDGQVSDVHTAESDFKEPFMHSRICEQIILESAPFDPWPSEMRQIVGATSREVQFTFIFR
jgi:hypothetical protein